MAETKITEVKLKIGTEAQFNSHLSELPTGTLVGTTDLITEDDLNTSVLTSFKTAILDAAYPVGAVYQSTSSTSPKTLFGGTWVALPSITDESKSLLMSIAQITSSFSYTTGSGSVTSEMSYRYNEDKSIIQISGRLSVTPTAHSGGIVGLSAKVFDAGVIKTAQNYIRCGYYYTSGTTKESIYMNVSTDGYVTIFNNASQANIPLNTNAKFVIESTIFNGNPSAGVIYRWKRTA